MLPFCEAAAPKALEGANEAIDGAVQKGPRKGLGVGEGLAQSGGECGCLDSSRVYTLKDH